VAYGQSESHEWTFALDGLLYTYGSRPGATGSAQLARSIRIDLQKAREKTATGNLTNAFESDM